jgi:hypothetical protein
VAYDAIVGAMNEVLGGSEVVGRGWMMWRVSIGGKLGAGLADAAGGTLARTRCGRAWTQPKNCPFLQLILCSGNLL